MNRFYAERATITGDLDDMDRLRDALRLFRGTGGSGQPVIGHFRHVRASERVTDGGDGTRDDGDALVLYWYAGDPPAEKLRELPYPIGNDETLLEVVRGWLRNRAEWPEYVPDTDGSVEKGWRVTNSPPREAFEYHSQGLLLVVETMWAVYGK